MKAHQAGELIGIVMLLFSTAAQVFYLEPLKREIEWRLATYSMQQAGQMQTRAVFDTHIATLEALNAPTGKIEAAKADRDKAIGKFNTADANISDYLVAKEPVEDIIQIGVLALFALGTLLTGIGRAMEMRAKNISGPAG